MSIYAYHLLKGLGLPEPRVVRLLRNLRTDTFKSNTRIHPKGSTPKVWSHLESGLVTACVPVEGQSAVMPVNIYGPGTWFGEAAILNPQATRLEYVSLTPARVVSMPLDDATEAFEQEPEFARYIARLISWRNQQYAEMLTVMRVGGPHLRVILGLTLFAEALRSSSSHLPTASTQNSLEIPLKQGVLASLCGVSRGLFSECLQQLANGGWLRLNYASLTLLNLEAWDRFSANYRHTRMVRPKPSLQDLLALLQQVNSTAQ